MVSVPVVGFTKPQTTLNSVVLPAPFGPMIPRMRPGGADRETSSSAMSPPKRTPIPFSDRLAVSAEISSGDDLMPTSLLFDGTDVGRGAGSPAAWIRLVRG